jgi:DNA (cytosine-5)-methyltransferase 1
MNPPTVVSLFSGCGGMDFGFKKAGFNIIWANDFSANAVTTYKKNIGDHIVLGDIAKIPSSNIPDNPDVILGGFPCQGFSIANSKKPAYDPRNFLYLEMIRVVNDKRPKFFVAENVKGMTSINDGQFIKNIISDFKDVGYKVEYKLLDMINYGVPQTRKRVIIIGNRIGAENPFPKETHGYGKGLIEPATTEETIGHLCNVHTREEPVKVKDPKTKKIKKMCNHWAKTKIDDEFWGRKYDVDQFDICDYLKHWRNKAGYGTKQIDEMFGYAYTAGHWFRKDNNSGSIPNPDDWWKLKEILGFDSKYDKQVTTMIRKKITYETSLRVNNWDEPNDTIIATGSEIHPKAPRRLSARECAIIQTFPDSFKFYGKIDSIHTQIGNAVPVLFAKKLGTCIKNELEKPMAMKQQSSKRKSKK